MATTQTNKSRFPSKYSNGYITPVQYAVENLCELIAKNRNTHLPFKFWELPEWNKLFRQHIAICNRLLKKYPIEVILETLQDPYIQKSKCLSFYFPPFKKLLDKNNIGKKREEILSKYHPADNQEPQNNPTDLPSVNRDGNTRPVSSIINKLKNL